MPTYEYECKKCGVFELFQSIKDEKLKRCPTCKGTVKRLMGSGAGIIFKGTGFYQTDYRSSNYTSGAKADSGVKTESSTKAAPVAKPDSGSKPSSTSDKK
ncbi:MAG: FmdB family zinc ribbon protein [bacterium]|jgi:putative FmdB family regulatory protein